jgi:hypothetical protein
VLFFVVEPSCVRMRASSFAKLNRRMRASLAIGWVLLFVVVAH